MSVLCVMDPMDRSGIVRIQDEDLDVSCCRLPLRAVIVAIYRVVILHPMSMTVPAMVYWCIDQIPVRFFSALGAVSECQKVQCSSWTVGHVRDPVLNVDTGIDNGDGPEAYSLFSCAYGGITELMIHADDHELEGKWNDLRIRISRREKKERHLSDSNTRVQSTTALSATE